MPGCKACAMEVSSHALVLHRVAYLRFRRGASSRTSRATTSISTATCTQYFAAKRRLFEMLPAGAPAIVNVDDPRGVELAATLPRVVTFGIDRPADVRATAVHSSLEGLAFEAETPRGPLAIRSPLVGRPNVYNILGVVATAIALDVPTPAIEEGIARLERVPGPLSGRVRQQPTTCAWSSTTRTPTTR